ncbi:phage integrase SAM-like domain-containing protein [Flavobacterium sp. AG291]|uniref:phage integrase SAM-like domain-containing protein n=1 Tax=Flavobacterium sp. AG291 TaxID=2184000 RepID=UPI000E0BB4D5|nr:phage integrase SAM-like domain-containing protein [Flavobacterium sp. AG291]RDI10245.1 phage integrase family protein [Flavobacterium sp. AG291]
MPTVNFLYRSTKEEANLNIRLLYRYNDKDFVFGGKSKVYVSKYYWEKIHPQKRIKDSVNLNLQHDINTQINKLSNHILKAFDLINPEQITNVWLKNQIDLYYNPAKDEAVPNTIIEYIDFYITHRRFDLKDSSIQKFKTIKGKLEKLQTLKKTPIYIKDINDKFKNEFIDFYISEGYAQNTIQRELSFVKTFCRHARSMGIETSPQLDNLKANKERSAKIYLTFDEISQIENIKEELSESLKNARDWLIISCYTGQRVSDFMRFKKDMIRIELKKGDNKEEAKKIHLLEFTQKKTGTVMSIPLSSKVLNILESRNGDFPYKISDQRYNEFIKTVCKIAGINTLVEGSIYKETEPESGIFRKKPGTYPKWELITSHVGRRSFATNYYGKVPTTYLKYITGHKSESMFLNYIGKSNKDMAMEISDYFV